MGIKKPLSIHYKGELKMYDVEKVNAIKKLFIGNGINIETGQEDSILDLDSLNFLSIMIDLEEFLGVSLEDNEELFSLDFDTISFNKILKCIEKYIK
jgi:acyl carrier protein